MIQSHLMQGLTLVLGIQEGASPPFADILSEGAVGGQSADRGTGPGCAHWSKSLREEGPGEPGATCSAGAPGQWAQASGHRGQGRGRVAKDPERPSTGQVDIPRSTCLYRECNPFFQKLYRFL